MSYQVLARKWRPRSFSEMAGQEHVLKALTHAVENSRLHHAYLFTGTRGVGKTTVARALAKSLNCEQGIRATPCGQCQSCQEIDQGRFVDLIEVDAASRTKVEDTRDLLDNVQYAPTRGRFKIYLIDEVHMLSMHSFNALLKTLEEPPEHVKFLLATTDPQKLPVTVLSRCLQFHLKRLSVAVIVERLNYILSQEQVEAEPAAVHAIARAADGSMRDALSLLDQAIAYGGGRLRAEEVNAMLGVISRDRVARIAVALAGGDLHQALAQVAELAEMAPDYGQVLAELVTLFYRVALAQVEPRALDEQDPDLSAVKQIAAALSPEDVQLFYQIALLGQNDLPLAPDPRCGLEMILIRMAAFRPVGPAGEGAAGGTTGPGARKQEPVAAPAASSAATGPVSSTSPPARPATSGKGLSWDEIVGRLSLEGMARQVAAHCTLQAVEDDRVSLVLAPVHGAMLSKRLHDAIEAALGTYFGRAIRLSIEVQDNTGETPAEKQARLRREKLQRAQQDIANDRNVQALLETFGGQVVPDSVRPRDEEGR